MVPLPWIFVHLCRTLSLPLLSGLYDTQGDPGGLDLKIPTKGFFLTYENRLIRERIYSHTHLCPIFRQFFGWFVASRQQTFFPKILPSTVYIVIYIHFKHLFRICIFSAMLATVMLSLIYFVSNATLIIQNFQHDTTFMSA